jgi:hypothetical protein
VVYVGNQGRYTYPFHPGKPKDGRQDCLVDHANSYANSNRNYKQKGQHIALQIMDGRWCITGMSKEECTWVNFILY